MKKDELKELVEKSLNEFGIANAYGYSMKTLRNHVGMTQEELAEKTSVSRQSISVYEKGKVIPTISQAYRISSYFGMTIDDFINFGWHLGTKVEYKGKYKQGYEDIIDYYESIKDKK